jgi:tRNA U38,U39,U40 pseudouridine synthase TruA
MSLRYYMVTFDLPNSAGRTNEYMKVRRDLQLLVGNTNYHAFTKQACIVQTSKDARAIRDRMVQKLGGNCNILVVRLRKGFAFKLLDPVARVQANGVLRSIPSA